MLVIFGGLPGSGKTTIARALAKRLGATYVRLDTIEQALRNSGVLRDEVGPAGYMVAYGIAGDNLKLGNTVIADCVNPISITREAWSQVAQRAAVSAIQVEVICSDKVEHRRRVETRQTDIEGHVNPTWNEVVTLSYDNWGPGPVVVDTALKAVDDIVTELVDRLRATEPR
ncbi:AAA family ATPase [Rhizobium sp. P44RR-XXIV]|uniref:AAA family ATPase n=1 Tax=Rhizobium sp. P44RR-XXIV TaxID=1921145 RepID=UPI000987017E|nr:AAA family ATPase [Rhizobium sp. P44RR-XXIV]TIX92542.1 AAA family ATPase [Rhizobium sp. P44RR-XXIV]